MVIFLRNRLRCGSRRYWVIAIFLFPKWNESDFQDEEAQKILVSFIFAATLVYNTPLHINQGSHCVS